MLVKMLRLRNDLSFRPACREIFRPVARSATLPGMTATVDIPIWLLVLILLFAGIAALDRVLGPTVRWFLRRRMERVVAELNKRLERPIQPFKLARRHDMIQRLIYDPKVAEAVAMHTRETGLREDVAFEEARRYAREIVPSFSASAYFGFAIRAARWLSTRLYDVRLETVDEAALAAIDHDATVVFVINHRSNMDYVLVTYLAAERSALSYAVGEWARVWPLSRLIRAMGAYFIRRKSRNALYRRVLARYVQLSTSAGVTQAIFPEGGLSVDGRVAPPRMGLLSYIVAGFDPRARDVVFVPVALNYDRVIEDRVLVAAARSGDRRFRGSFLTGARFAARWLWRRVTGQARRFGVAAVSFGAPLSMKAIRDETPQAGPTTVADMLMARIAAQVPVTPVPLMAAALAETGTPVMAEDLLARARTLLPPGVTRPEDLEGALRMLKLRHILVDGPDGITIRPGQEAVVEYYAASVEHLIRPRRIASEPTATAGS